MNHRSMSENSRSQDQLSVQGRGEAPPHPYKPETMSFPERASLRPLGGAFGTLELSGKQRFWDAGARRGVPLRLGVEWLMLSFRRRSIGAYPTLRENDGFPGSEGDRPSHDAGGTPVLPGEKTFLTRLLGRRLWIVLFCVILCGWGLGWAQDATPGFLKVSGPCGLRFPEDHGAHEGYRTEWWYYTGNVRTEAGRLFGFQLTFFRYQLVPTEANEKEPDPVSPWRTNQMYFAHAALSDVEKGRFLYDEKALRGAAGLAGAERTEEGIRVWVHPWMARLGPNHHELQAEAGHFSLHLRLVPQKPLVLHGIEGYSLKGSSPDRASCYYSWTRLEVQGTVRTEDEVLPVTGYAWMDHEYSSEPLEPVLQGWDWFSLQLDDGTELMLFGLRQKDGTWHSASSGTFVEASGTARHVSRDEIVVEVLSTWKSPRSKASYPAAWRLHVPSLALDLSIRPNLADQELETQASTGVTYWEGSVSFDGTRQGKSVRGLGYVELTGYARPFDAPL